MMKTFTVFLVSITSSCSSSILGPSLSLFKSQVVLFDLVFCFRVFLFANCIPLSVMEDYNVMYSVNVTWMDHIQSIHIYHSSTTVVYSKVHLKRSPVFLENENVHLVVILEVRKNTDPSVDVSTVSVDKRKNSSSLVYF